MAIYALVGIWGAAAAANQPPAGSWGAAAAVHAVALPLHAASHVAAAVGGRSPPARAAVVVQKVVGPAAS